MNILIIVLSYLLIGSLVVNISWYKFYNRKIESIASNFGTPGTRIRPVSEENIKAYSLYTIKDFLRGLFFGLFLWPILLFIFLCIHLERTSSQ